MRTLLLATLALLLGPGCFGIASGRGNGGGGGGGGGGLDGGSDDGGVLISGTQHTFTAGWATFGQVVPQGAATSGLQTFPPMPLQTDVKTRWPDGSIRFAVVTAQVTEAGTYQLASGPASGGPAAATNPAASVTLTISGTPYVAQLPPFDAQDPWLFGPLVVESRYRVVPLNAGTPHPFLEVVFDVRIYSDGAKRVDVAVENVLNKSGAALVTYDVDVDVEGQNRYHEQGVGHFYETRWRKTFEVGLTPSVLQPDFGALLSTRALPRYLSTVSNASYDVSAVTSSVFLARSGYFANVWDGTKGFYPPWVGQYLVHATQNQRDYLLAIADRAGSWPSHLRELDHNLVSIDARPGFWSDNRGAGANGALGNTQQLGPFYGDSEHLTSYNLTYPAYLLTGDRYYADEMAFWANWGLTHTWPEPRTLEKGILFKGNADVYGFQLLALVDAALYLPDAHPAKGYLKSKLESNLHWLDLFAAGQSDTVNYSFRLPLQPYSPIGATIEVPEEGNPWSGISRTTPRDEARVGWAIHHANRQGFPGGEAVRDRIATFALRLLTSGPAYPPAYGAPYSLIVGVNGNPGPSHFLASMQELFDTNFVSGGTVLPPTSLEFYGPQARAALLVAIEASAPGADAAFDDLTTKVTTLNDEWSLAR